MKTRLFFSYTLVILGLLNFTSGNNNTADWNFKKEKEGIKVYTRDLPDSNLKELKITFRVEASLNSIVALLNDVDEYQNWVYRCLESKTIERRKPTESVDYYIMDFPWPLTDRDLTVHSVYIQDPISKVITSSTTYIDGYADEKPELVRIKKHNNKWIFKPISATEVDVVYTLNSHPAGNIPDWLINMAVDQGPMESMKRFRNMLKTKNYVNAKVKGILDY